MPLLTLRWDDPRAQNPELVGPKAANLARLLAAGLPVPAFFVLVWTDGGDVDWVKSEVQPRLPRILRDLRGAGAQAFAVRSSSLVEDRAAGSLAGQFYSATGLVSEDSVLEAVRRCLASGQTEEVRATLRAKGQRDLPRVNVLLQQNVQAKWAGVAFETSPRVDLHTTLIEAEEGSTDAVTGGRSVSERVLVSSGPHRLPVAVGLLGDQPVPAPEGEDFPDWLAIHALADRAARTLGFSAEAVDLEWAWDGRQLWLLQARPGQRPPLPGWLTEAPERVWTSYFFAERFTRPVSPLGWDMLRSPVEIRAFREPLVYLGHPKLAKLQLTRLVRGRPHTRWSVFRKLHELLSPEFLHADKRLAFFPDGLPRIPWPSRIARLVRAWLRVVEDPDWLPWANLRRWRRFVPEYVRGVRQLAKEIDAHDHPEALLSDLDRAQGLSLALLALHRWSLTFAEIFLRLLEWEISFGLRVDASRAHSLATDLLRQLSGNLTAEFNRALSSLVGLSETERAALLWDFLEKHGHRSPSLDIAEPTWRERPDLLLKLASGGVEGGKNLSPADGGTRRALQQRILSSCRLPAVLRTVWTAVFRATLRLGEEFALLRENQRHYWHLVLEQKRRAALKIGAILQERGVLETPELVFELNRRELEKVATGFSLLRGLNGRLRERQRARLELAGRPVGLLWDETQAEQQTALADGTKDSFRGLGVSPGRAKGRVVRVTGPELPSVPNGSVLVLGGLDPGWTPLLGRVAALVTEVGGALSHGAILAREFGVPAVAGVSGARLVFRDGDLVEVDGTVGIVRVLEREGG